MLQHTRALARAHVRKRAQCAGSCAELRTLASGPSHDSTLPGSQADKERLYTLTSHPTAGGAYGGHEEEKEEEEEAQHPLARTSQSEHRKQARLLTVAALSPPLPSPSLP